MFFSEKVETVGGIKDFLQVSPTKKKVLTGVLAGLGVGALATMVHAPQQAVTTMAMPMPVLGLSITDKIIRACDPIIQLVTGIAYPIGFIMITTGFLVMMTGNRQKGLSLIKWAAIGYIGTQFAPSIMKILVEVGSAMGR